MVALDPSAGGFDQGVADICRKSGSYLRGAIFEIIDQALERMTGFDVALLLQKISPCVSRQSRHALSGPGRQRRPLQQESKVSERLGSGKRIAQPPIDLVEHAQRLASVRIRAEASDR
jgi:hypothetical protein